MFLSIVDNGWMLRGRRIWYSMHSLQSARPGCRCCRACTFTWSDDAPRRIGCVARLAGPTPLSRGRRPVEERRARDSLADCQSHGMYLAKLFVRLWLRTGRSAHASKVGCGRLGVGAVGRVRVWCTDEVRRGPARGRGCQSRVVRTGRACRFTHGRHKSTR
jgi:hypothetical protein